jgi:uncharacterized protein (TIGR02996 family)
VQVTAGPAPAAQERLKEYEQGTLGKKGRGPVSNIEQRAAFMRQVCENPKDDTVRLVFADWLEEYGGDPLRAEFIRLQIDLHHSEPGYVLDWKQNSKIHDESMNPKIRRAAELCRKVAWTKGDPYKIWPTMAQLGAVWTRGFVGEWHGHTNHVVAHGARIGEHPVEKFVLENIRNIVEDGLRGHEYVSGDDSGPIQIFNLIEGDDHSPHKRDGNPYWRSWSTRKKAEQAWSDACVKYVRQQAGIEAR